MLRLLSVAPRVLARSAGFAARTAVVRAAAPLAAAAARTFTRSAPRCAAKEQNDVDEQEEERSQSSQHTQTSTQQERAESSGRGLRSAPDGMDGGPRRKSRWRSRLTGLRLSCPRCLSLGVSEPIPFPEAASGVVSAVAAELASFDTSDEYVESYTKDHALTVSANMDAETLVITRKSQNHDIRITMRAEALEQEEPEEDAKDDDEDETKLPEHRFFIDITNPKGSIMRLECFNSPQGELEVGSLTFPSSVAPDLATVSRADSDKADEAAPVALRVDEMEESTSSAFFAYLESLGVDDDLAVFVASQAQIVRTKAQMARLEKFKNFAQL